MLHVVFCNNTCKRKMNIKFNNGSVGRTERPLQRNLKSPKLNARHAAASSSLNRVSNTCANSLTTATPTVVAGQSHGLRSHYHRHNTSHPLG